MATSSILKTVVINLDNIDNFITALELAESFDHESIELSKSVKMITGNDIVKFFKEGIDKFNKM